ncbi:MAG: transketolase [Candidatus Wallbacteria bacterium GWC2_49_35]|uniref:Transketolase n=1 Tax=Candidatus Wallbacteria bacterium GWC2_49_35 TaxID=1817813 RepID=A0A1F7WG23_9BACT|nr:MAG: transketolase [Candidatus Wallbacteria bacterium GWC2_49_35]HBC74175.1 transketolase [Candidatus Wallbacteria bacterium]
MAEFKATRNGYGEALVELGAKNPKVVVLDADLSKSTMTYMFGEKYPERFFNMGIAEQNLMGTAAGLSAAGYVPFASSFGIFASGRAYEQIRNIICYAKLNVKIGGTHGGITVGEDGATHQGLEEIALMRVIPNMCVIVPADFNEAKAATVAACEYNGPVYLRLGRDKVETITDYSKQSFEIGKGYLLADGADVTIIATGLMSALALHARTALAAKGVSAAVIHLPTVKPLDTKLIYEYAQKTRAIVTCEEHQIACGMGSAVCEFLAQNIPTPVKMVGIKDVFGESGTPKELLEAYGLNANGIAEAAGEVLTMKK